MSEQASRRQSLLAGDVDGGTMNEQSGRLQTPFRAAPERPPVASPVITNGSAGFVRAKRRTNPAALLFSVLLSAALLGLMLLLSGAADRVRPVVESMVMVPLTQDVVKEPTQSEEEPVDQPEVKADSPEEASPSSSEQTVAPAPALPDIPIPAIPLTETPVPQTPIPAEAPTVQPGADSNGDQAQGALGRGGQGGDGIGGNGNGGAGRGNGTGNRLTASWAPDMDFSLLNYYYPKQALKDRIEGIAWLSCYVPRFGLVRKCKLLAESPEGLGFGKAAFRSRQSFRIEVRNQAGRRVYNEWVTIRAFFILPPLEVREAEAQDSE
jgi:hypothetical protein